MTVGGILRKQIARFLELGLHSFLASQQGTFTELLQFALTRSNRPLGLLHDALGVRDLAAFISGRLEIGVGLLAQFVSFLAVHLRQSELGTVISHRHVPSSSRR